MNPELLKNLEKLYENRFVAFSELADFKQKNAENLPDLKTLKHQKSRAFFSLNRKAYQNTKKLYDFLENREKLNHDFIKREQQKVYEIEGNKLDPDQIAAVVACEDAALFLAPAGSGKSASLLAKVNYLVDELDIPPEDVLVIAFTNKVVAELKDRVKDQKVEIRTFHSLGNKLLKLETKTKSKVKTKAQSNPQPRSLISETDTVKFFHRTIAALKAKNKTYQENFQKYLETTNPETVFALSSEKTEDPTIALEQLFISVLGLQKSEHADLVEFKRRLEQLKNPVRREKALAFYEIYAPVAEAYQKHLQTANLYDFADMLNLSTDFIETLPKNSFNYQYILVDEAQDLSTSKYRLLKALLKKCQKVKLFAVGDDWQSIYRFAGSNLKVLDDFEQIFERETYRGLIELTYRFGEPTAKISNKFIQKNPYQSRKKVVSRVNYKTPIEIKLNFEKPMKNIPPDYYSVDQKLTELYHEYGETLFSKKVQIISRYNRDIFRLVDETEQNFKHAELINNSESAMELSWKIPVAGNKKLTIPFCSMHKAKGITRDIVLVINVNSGNHGMPATRGDDPIMATLLTKLDDFPFAEERRLFYVAITRARNKTILFADARSISKFIFEINPKLTGAGAKVCPKCHRGILLKRHRRDGKVYYSCSNFSEGCHYIE